MECIGKISVINILQASWNAMFSLINKKQYWEKLNCINGNKLILKCIDISLIADIFIYITFVCNVSPL